ncbi:conserved hypothetical protein [Vibrio nigripulchritudo SFn27]|uniref:Methyl-accepting chemotaxis protein n=1 Tax=Vibrio nigripulchritudo TaxID=28173 RepID=U4K9T8_9VIBR|nr:hypothetical protein [Vibrio nigripulchritudo]CCN85477.1 conserved hypothetical protein [Vibrio nigripulchritudo BLFn1]CCN89054.1 conserved hypothetical protein [Vibrio nigripulchritudo SFn27]CCN95446.1 conserved hypothetical protein [Vibrio nigripulchritudo ENn2]CCO43203.1 conserved hypothetical protein [Vibrio nigripulchritudo SFn135]CCO54511.1 conserved hypothetical protein [Vibrio nigripulchritudo Wn13]
MGKGGDQKSTSNTTTTNTSGQNAIQGDNLGTAISGVNDSTIMVSATDHGAIEAARELGELAINGNATVATNAIDMSEAVTKEAFDLSFQTSEMVSDAHSKNLQYIAGLAGSNAANQAENLKAVRELASKKMDGGAENQTKYMVMGLGLLVGAFVVVNVIKEVN